MANDYTEIKIEIGFICELYSETEAAEKLR